MTDRGGPSQQRPTPAAPPRAPQGWSGGVRREGREPQDLDRGAEALLAPRESVLVEESMTAVGRRGRGPVVAAALIAAAFLLGVLRPWDLLPSTVPATAAPGSGAVVVAVGPVPASASPLVPTNQLTCAYPSQWRSSTIQDWAGRTARVWTAVHVVRATGPDDPSIPFEPVIAASVTAIGWCAPVEGPDRPPLALTATLFRLQDGVARPIPYDRLEPAAPDALGELWLPRPRGVGNRPTWAMGRYVIELRSASGAYTRFLGLELMDRVVRPGASEEPSPSGEASPGGEPSP